MKVILANINNDAGQDARLQTALDLARLHGAHLTCLQAMPFAAYAGEPFTGAMLSYEAYAEAMTATRKRVEDKLRNEGVSWDWIDARGSGSLAVIAHSSLADLAILSPDVGSFDPDVSAPIVGEVVVRSDTPVLVVRNAQRGIDGEAPALIAWNGSTEAAQAIRSCLHYLAKSRSVHIVTIEESSETHLPARDAATYLSRWGINAEVHARGAAGSVAETIQSVAAEVRAGVIVMGAYGHSRLREFVLGGVTREMLKTSPLPLLLAH